jgi:hypothetical protein
MVESNPMKMIADTQYKLTQLGMSLGAAFCGVGIWVAEHLKQIEQARRKFDQKGTTCWSDDGRQMDSVPISRRGLQVGIVRRRSRCWG